MRVLPLTRFVSAPLLPLVVALSGGIVLQHYGHFQTETVLIPAFAATFSSAIGCLIMLKAARLFAATLFLLAAFFVAGMLLVMLAERPAAANRISRMYDEGVIAAGDPVELMGVIVGEPEPAPQSFYLTLSVEQLTHRNVERAASGKILLIARKTDQNADGQYDALGLRHGARIRVMTRLDREDDFRNPGRPPFAEYLDRKGYDATGAIKSALLVERLDDDSVFLPIAWLYEWRARLQKEFAGRFSAETAGVLNAALLGNPHNISGGAAERFRAGGTFHILVISGLQIAFIAGVAFLIVRRLTNHRLIQFLLPTIFLWGYAIAVGGEASVTRAALMFTVAAFAPVVARRANSVNAVAGAGLALLIIDPLDIFDPSFQLTFLSVLAIVCLAVPLLENMRRAGAWRPTMVTPHPPVCSSWFRKLAETLFWSEREWRAEMAGSNVKYRLFKSPLAAKLECWRMQRPLRYATAAVIVSASVQLALLPLMVVYFHRVSIGSLLLNIFVGGLMALLGVTALAAVLIAQISGALAAPLIALSENVNWIMVHLVDPLANVGLASLRLPHYHGWAASIYGVYLALLIVLILRITAWNPLRRQRMRPMGNIKRFTARVVAGGFIGALLMILFHPFSAARPDGRLRIDFLDVGQGDCALLTTPEGITILIDGGGQAGTWTRNESDNRNSEFERDISGVGERVVSEYLWSRGLDRVDYLIATHADTDHIDGLNDVARNFRTQSAIVARAPAEDREFRKFSETLNQRGVPIQIIGAGDVMRLGGVAIDVLWPAPVVSANAPSQNNDSLVLRVRFGEKSFLFGGDIEERAERSLSGAGLNLRSDLVKVAHHGSRTSSTQEFVDATRPTYAIIPVGRQSMFGHPHKEVVERWRASGAQVMTTGEKGTISVVTDGQHLDITTFIK